MTVPKTKAIREHRRQTRLMIWLPFAGGLLLLIVLLVIAANQGGDRISVMSDVFLTLTILCPLVLCFFPIYLLVVLAVAGMNRAHNTTARALTRVEDASAKLKERTLTVTDRAARASININSRFAFISRLSQFGSPSRKGTHE